MKSIVNPRLRLFSKLIASESYYFISDSSQWTKNTEVRSNSWSVSCKACMVVLSDLISHFLNLSTSLSTVNVISISILVNLHDIRRIAVNGGASTVFQWFSVIFEVNPRWMLNMMWTFGCRGVLTNQWLISLFPSSALFTSSSSSNGSKCASSFINLNLCPFDLT